MKLIHGGNLNQISKQYAIPAEQWLDLSTGISPFSYPVPEIPTSIWRELPQINPSLIEAAKRYYRTHDILPTSGSQSVISVLPKYHQQYTTGRGRVWLPVQGYKEHEKAWKSAGYPICHYSELPEHEQLQQHDILVVINPNNPTGACASQQQLLALQSHLASLCGWLIVDEAFMDTLPTNDSIAPYSHLKNVFVLRSMGKFFGLAGLRVGFLSAASEHIKAVDTTLGPWTVNGPALYIANKALGDKQWQARQKRRLKAQTQQLKRLLFDSFAQESTGTHLFQTLYLESAPALFDLLCKNGVYTRLTDEQDALRFGIPGTSDLKRLAAVLRQLSKANQLPV